MRTSDLNEEAYLEFMAVFNAMSPAAMHDPEKVADLLNAAILRSVLKSMANEMLVNKWAKDILIEHADGMFYDVANGMR